MNKEELDLIEEMIDQLKEYASGGVSGLYPFEESVKALLDYINQLEEENKQLKVNRNEAIKYINDEAIGVAFVADEYYLIAEREQKELLSILERGKE